MQPLTFLLFKKAVLLKSVNFIETPCKNMFINANNIGLNVKTDTRCDLLKRGMLGEHADPDWMHLLHRKKDRIHNMSHKSPTLE